MSGFSGSDWFGTSTSTPPTSQVPKTESLGAHMDGANVGGTLSQAAANVNSAGNVLLYWQAGIIVAALVILWALGALAGSPV